MTFEILDPFARALVALNSDVHRPIGETYCEAEQKNTLKQVVTWGKEICYNAEHIKIEGSARVRRLCTSCWRELQELAQ